MEMMSFSAGDFCAWLFFGYGVGMSFFYVNAAGLLIYKGFKEH